MNQKFLTSFSSVVSPDDTIILAVSGGVDSMVLLDLVMNHHPRAKIIIVHFDHSLRGVESDGDREFVANFCDRFSLRYEQRKMDIGVLSEQEKGSIESVARKYRYEFFNEMAQKHHAQYILTAHHLDDRIETALFNLIRGTKLGGIHALGQLSYIDPNTFSHHQSPVTSHQSPLSIFRPLLGTTKSEIIEYASEHHIEYREDSSNADTDYQRNNLRHHILPLFETINSEYRHAVSNFIDYTVGLKDWIDSEIQVFFQGRNEFLVTEFVQKSLFFQKEIIRYLYERQNSGTIGLSEGNIDELIRYITTAEGGTEKELGKLRLTKRNNHIFIH